jgi:hypothetical protein
MESSHGSFSLLLLFEMQIYFGLLSRSIPPEMMICFLLLSGVERFIGVVFPPFINKIFGNLLLFSNSLYLTTWISVWGVLIDQKKNNFKEINEILQKQTQIKIQIKNS